VLMPYLLAGSGHLSSATAIKYFIETKQPGWHVRLFEPADELNLEILNANYKRSWQFLLKWPILGKILFFLAEKVIPFVTIAANKNIAKKAAPDIAGFLSEYDPDLVITTHWSCGHLVDAAWNIPEDSKNGSNVSRVPLIVVRNDLGGVYKIQQVDCDLTVVMSEEGIEAFKAIGVPGDKLMQANLLVRPEFLVHRKTTIDDITLDSSRPLRILLSAGGEGLGNLFASADMILTEASNAGRNIELELLAGRNQKLSEKLFEHFRGSPVNVHGYREDMPALMSSVDLVVGKCGANYTMETLMLGKPFLITQIGAPNEKPNMEYVVSRGCGWYAKNRVAERDIFALIFSNPAEIHAKMKNLAKLPSMSGAEQIADRVILELGG
ncbi:MAG: hypothetical protein HN368_01740, partial [Spirochaetales bacterium]|nr:hypothetical protein [Spirochaetales bacterium]